MPGADRDFDQLHPGSKVQRSSTMSSDEHGRNRLTKTIAAALFAVTVLEVVIAIVGAALTGTTLDDALDSYLVTNCAIGFSCAASGVLIAWNRPRNPVGWLLAAAGVLYPMTAAVSPALTAALDRGWSNDVIRTVLTVYFAAWPWAITLCLPLALLLFPTGRMPSPRWTWLVWVGAIGGTVSAIGQATAPSEFGPTTWITLPNHHQLAMLWQLADWTVDAIYLASLVLLVVRFRRGDEKLRRQLLWLVLSLTIAIVVQAFWGPLVDGLAVLNLLSIALVPISMTIAVLRYQLLDIRLVLSRTVLYLLLSAGVLGVYLLLVAIAGLVLTDPGRGTTAVITMLIAVGFNPVRVRLQRVVDRALYGDRVDPVRVVSRIGEQLAGGDERDVLRAVTDALRLPYAAVVVDGVEWAAHGTAAAATESIALNYRGTSVGRLVIGVRPGESSLARADRAALELLAAPLAVAAHATRLSEDLQRSREEIVSSREEERRRLRRDLHDGLGTALTGIAFQADAARNLVRSNPDHAEQLLAALRSGAAEAIGDVRRLVYALRPPSLDELGLVGAIRRQVDRLDSGATSVTLAAPGPIPDLPAAVEVAAYRIVLEALTNATRHARARTIEVKVQASDEHLEVTVDDDGETTGDWQPGVGMVAMRERTAELGGSLQAGPSATGGRVVARLPILAPEQQRHPAIPAQKLKSDVVNQESATPVAIPAAP
jgi:signal transduction histidine kinase